MRRLDLIDQQPFPPGLEESGFSGQGYRQIALPYADGDFITDFTKASDGNFSACMPLRHGPTASSSVSTTAASHSNELLLAVAMVPSRGKCLQGSDGTILGVTQSGGSGGQGETANGVVFTLQPALPAPKPLFVSFTPTHGKVGSQVIIHGVHFVGTTVVEFNGVNATFQVLNTGNILATVPAGATTGPLRSRMWEEPRGVKRTS